MDDTPTAALYDHGVSKHKWCNHRLIGQNKGSVYSVQYFCCYGFILWCHDLGLSRPPRGPVCVCVLCTVFFARLCPDCVFVLWGSVHVMQRFDFLSAAEDCLLKKKGAIRYQEHTFKNWDTCRHGASHSPIDFFYFLLLRRSFICNNAPLLCRPLYRGSHTHVYTCAASSWQFVSLTCTDVVCLSCLNWIKFFLWQHQDIWSFLLYTQGHMATE